MKIYYIPQGLQCPGCGWFYMVERNVSSLALGYVCCNGNEGCRLLPYVEAEQR
jgi:hypothetical protein